MQTNKPPPPPGRPNINQRVSAINLASRSHQSSSSPKAKLTMKHGHAMILPSNHHHSTEKITMKDKDKNVVVVEKNGIEKKLENVKVETTSPNKSTKKKPSRRKKMASISPTTKPRNSTTSATSSSGRSVENIHTRIQYVDELEKDQKDEKLKKGRRLRTTLFSPNTRPRFMRAKNQDKYLRVEEEEEELFLDE